MSGFTGCLSISIIAGHERVSYWSPCWVAGATGPMSLTNTMIRKRPKRA